MTYCADTSVLLRWIERGTPACKQAQDAVSALWLRRETVFITPQNLVEFWNGATRPISVNGLGLTPVQADQEARTLEGLFPLLPETAAIHAEWRKIVVALNVSGSQVHDARLAAALTVHGVSRILTFNTKDFKRYSSITAVSPADIQP